MKHLLSKLLFGLLLVSTFCCKKNQTEEPPTTPPIVHAAGIVFNTSTNQDQAVYWRDGVVTFLTTGATGANANSIFVAGNDVYVAGFEKNVAGKPVATYWKNGVATTLGNNNNSSIAHSIGVVGSDVYVAGYVRISSTEVVFRYWKNGVDNIIPNQLDLGKIAISGSDWFMTGTKSNQRKNIFKNGIEVPALTSNFTSGGTDCFVVGNDVYATGYSTITGNLFRLVTYWKNGNETILSTDATYNGNQGNSIAIAGNDVYVAGVKRISPFINTASYWKNGTETILSSPANNSWAAKIAVHGKDVYVSGSEYYSGTHPRIWKNGVPILLADNILGAVYDMCVK